MPDRAVKLVDNYYLAEIEYEDRTFKDLDKNMLQTLKDRIVATEQIYNELVEEYNNLKEKENER